MFTKKMLKEPLLCLKQCDLRALPKGAKTMKIPLPLKYLFIGFAHVLIAYAAFAFWAYLGANHFRMGTWGQALPIVFWGAFPITFVGATLLLYFTKKNTADINGYG